MDGIGCICADNVKKMCSIKKELLSNNKILGFTYPKLHKGKVSYVDFFFYDSLSDSMRRKKYMLGRFTSKRERDTMAAILISNLVEKLKKGWNPFASTIITRPQASFSDVLQKYEDYTFSAEEKMILKHKTAVDYRSRLKQLRIYLKEANVKIQSVYQFDKAFVIDFLDYLILDKDVSAKTRNNYRTWLSTFATWLKDRQFIDNNFMEEIHLLKEGDKKRDPIPQKELHRLKIYGLQHKPAFYLACMMEYYCFIRPDELRYVKIGDISIKDQTVYVHPEFAKNRKGQYVALNDQVIKIMLDQRVFDHPSHHYLISRDLTPGPEQSYINQYRYEWSKVRKALGWPMSYQFYSLKDSGIRDLANAEGIVLARDQARHTDVSVTNKYLKNTRYAHDETKHFKGEL